MKDFVYVISGEHGRRRIGCSDNPRQRLKELQTGSPYPLKFEFIGEAENKQIELEAYFMLNQHKSPGDDEWFTVPPDVAVTTVMAAANRLGYRIKQVDPDAVAPPNSRRQPLWVTTAMLPFVAAYAYWIFEIAYRHLESGEIPMETFVIEALVLGVALVILRSLIRWFGDQSIALWQAWLRLMNPG